MNNPPGRNWPPEGTFADLTPERQRAYVAGLAHAYGSVFDAFGVEFDQPKPSVAAALDRVKNQWAEVEAMIAVEDVL